MKIKTRKEIFNFRWHIRDEKNPLADFLLTLLNFRLNFWRSPPRGAASIWRALLAAAGDLGANFSLWAFNRVTLFDSKGMKTFLLNFWTLTTTIYETRERRRERSLLETLNLFDLLRYSIDSMTKSFSFTRNLLLSRRRAANQTRPSATVHKRINVFIKWGISGPGWSVSQLAPVPRRRRGKNERKTFALRIEPKIKQRKDEI